ncbi:haloacid dehalogenase-like hydrolase [Streptomyces sp. NPDC050263]|uniref:HAD family hydrolase n=1 Tax=Streptomyces sp. NPDC050263 TaxID=3155037 RepID=UPI00343D1CFD
MNSITQGSPARPPLTVGFDLDMTLADGRPGIKAVLDRLAAESGVSIDSDLAITRVGPPIEEELAHWFEAAEVMAAADRYRALFPEFGAPVGTVLPGALEAIAAVRGRGGRAIVVTGKFESNARLNLASLGIEVDEVFGSVFADRKGTVLLEQGASVYVGDHLGDIKGARAGDALAVAVATGPYSADELRAAGADAVLNDLTEFPAWLDGHLVGV